MNVGWLTGKDEWMLVDWQWTLCISEDWGMNVDWQVKMLQALGMKSTLITDGSSPINLFTTANGLVGNMVARRGTRNTEDDDWTASFLFVVIGCHDDFARFIALMITICCCALDRFVFVKLDLFVLLLLLLLLFVCLLYFSSVHSLVNFRRECNLVDNHGGLGTKTSKKLSGLVKICPFIDLHCTLLGDLLFSLFHSVCLCVCLSTETEKNAFFVPW